MTVAELIEKLNDVPKDMTVWTWVSDDDDLKQVSAVRVVDDDYTIKRNGGECPVDRRN